MNADEEGLVPRAGVIGWPVKHSRSPKLHGYWLKQYGLKGRYDLLPLPPEDLGEFLTALKRSGKAENFRGVNVTLPHKEAVLPYLDEIDDAAKRIGAANTLILREDGSLYGQNTDGYGFLQNLRESQPNWQPQAGPGIMLGAGGGARAICVALLDAGLPALTIVNRNMERAETLAQALNDGLDDPRVSVADWERRADLLEGAGLLVNSTSLGMTGQPPLDIALDGLPRSALVTDIVYAPLETGLLAAARARGNPVVDGLGMLLHQGRPGFAAWFGQWPEVTPGLRDAVLAD